MTLPQTTLSRLETQLDTLPLFTEGLGADALAQRPPSNKWSIHEHTAHLGRYHEVFLERLRRILDEDRPNLGRYRADDDPDFGSWTMLSSEGVVEQLKVRRAELLEFVKALNADQLARIGVHPVLGEMDVTLWLEFFLLHEAHHLYRILWLSKTGE